MEITLLVLAIVFAVCAIAAAIYIIVLIKQNSSLRETQSNLMANAISYSEEIKNLHKDKENLEKVITGLKTDINVLLGELDEYKDPAAIRERLRRML